jgi:predicted TIM-barrel fold metal-dependent hydrolase
VTATLGFLTTTMALSDWLFSGALARHPGLQICFAEGQIGWIPYVLERADNLWKKEIWGTPGNGLAETPSAYMPQITVCFYDDIAGLEARERIGVRQICFETDYPHQDSTWPHTRDAIARFADLLDDAELDLVLRGNAARLLGIDG